MLKFQSTYTTVVVSLSESERLDKYAESCLGKKVRERLLLIKKEKEKIYSFESPELRDEFIKGLKAIFGASAVLIR